MKLKSILIQYYITLNETRHCLKVHSDPTFHIAQLEADIIRYVHGLEKGLSLAKPRLGFGIKKIFSLFELIDDYLQYTSDSPICVYMAHDAVSAYLDFHKTQEYHTEKFELISKKLQDLRSRVDIPSGEKYGGTQTLDSRDLPSATFELENFFKSRHSVRNFSGKPVSEDDLQKAIELAQSCPSACNRQCVRIYSVSYEKYKTDTGIDLQGVGGSRKKQIVFF